MEEGDHERIVGHASGKAVHLPGLSCTKLRKAGGIIGPRQQLTGRAPVLPDVPVSLETDHGPINPDLRRRQHGATMDNQEWPSTIATVLTFWRLVGF